MAGGVMPIGRVADLTDWTKQGLTMGAQGAPGLGFMQGAQGAYQQAVGGAPDPNGMFNSGRQFYQTSRDFLGEAQGNLNRGSQPLSDEGFNSYMGRYFNPYQDQVVKNTEASLARQANMRRNSINANASEAGAFGGDAQGVERSLLNRDLLQQTADTTGSLLHQGYNDSLNRTLQNYQMDNNFALQGGQAQLQGANIAGDLGNQKFNQGFQALDRLGSLAQTGFAGNTQNWANTNNRANALTSAGGAVGNYNQAVLDAVRADKLQPTDYLGNSIGYFPQSSTGPQAGRPNMMSQAGGAGMVASQLPWGSIFGGGYSGASNDALSLIPSR